MVDGSCGELLLVTDCNVECPVGTEKPFKPVPVRVVETEDKHGGENVKIVESEDKNVVDNVKIVKSEDKKMI